MADSIEDEFYRSDNDHSSSNESEDEKSEDEHNPDEKSSRKNYVLLRKRDREMISASTPSDKLTKAQKQRMKKSRKMQELKQTIHGKSVDTLYENWTPEDVAEFLNKHAQQVLAKSTIVPIQISSLQVTPIFSTPTAQRPPLVETLQSLAPDRWEKIFCCRHSKGRTLPRVLIFCHSAIRAAELYDSLKHTQFNGILPSSSKKSSKKSQKQEPKTKVSMSQSNSDPVRIAKLFGKHFKLQDQIEYLSKTPVSIGIGTPGRIQQIFEQDPSLLQKLEWVILDLEKNSKNFTLLEVSDTSKPLFQFLFQTCQSLFENQKLKLSLY